LAKRKRRLSPRKLPNQKRSRETVDCILAATTRILERDGILALSTNRVAREAGVSIGSLYQYFPAKEALIAALVEERLRVDKAYFEEALGGFESWPLERLIDRLVEAGIELHRRDRKILKVMFEQLGPSGQLDRVKQVNMELYHLLLSAMTSPKGRWAGRKEEAACRAYVCMQAILGVWHSQVEEPWISLDAKQVSEALKRMVLAGVG